MKRIRLFIIAIVCAGFILSCTSYDYPDDFGFNHKAFVVGHEDQILDLAVSPDGKYLISGSFDATARVWDTSKLSEIASSEIHPDEIYSVCFEKNMRFAATGCKDGAVRIYSLPNGELVHLMRGHVEEIYSIAFSPDGSQLVSGGKDGTVRVWDVNSGELLRVFREHGDEVYSVAISPDGSIAYSASNDGTVRSWYLKEDLVPGFIEKITKYGLATLKLSPDGKKIAVNGVARLYNRNIKNWQIVYPLYIADIGSNGLENIDRRIAHTQAAWALAWSPDGKTIVTGGNDDRLFFWDVANSNNRQKVLPKVGSIWDLEFSPDGSKLFVASSSPDILVYMK